MLVPFVAPGERSLIWHKGIVAASPLVNSTPTMRA